MRVVPKTFDDSIFAVPGQHTESCSSISAASMPSHHQFVK